MAKQSKALVKEAEALGIEVDGRWGDETLQEQIDEARDAASAKRAEAEEKAKQDADRLNADAGGDTADGSPVAADGAAGEAAAVEDGAAPLLSPSDTPPAGVSAEEWDKLTADPYKTLQEALDLATGAPSAAYEAATAVYEALTPATEPGGDRWFCSDETDALDANVALVLVAVPFVRTWPEAPIEALYAHTAKSHTALDLSKPWPALNRPTQAAWETFHDVLVKVDAMQRADAAALAATQADTRPRFTVAYDETTLEEVDEPGALSELGRMAAARS